MSSKLENFPFIFCASSPSGFSSSAFFKSSTEPFLSPFISFARSPLTVSTRKFRFQFYRFIE